VWSAERDDAADVPPAVDSLEEVGSDESSHRVADDVSELEVGM
jgi:hypothetical protein